MKEKNFSKTARSMVSINKGSSSSKFEMLLSGVDPLAFLINPSEGRIEDPRFFSSAAENPAAQTYQGT